jgi:glycosyltransferase involved in cell wall biosynthesis
MENLSSTLVSIIVLTYNQEKTVSQTLDSIFDQNIDFPVEIIIGEDCSTDSTRKICLDYQNKYPQIVRLISHDRNQGIIRNYQSIIELCRGKYIAECAGDDYWHNRDKLKLQVDFLENNPDYGLVHTNIDKLYVKSNELKIMKRNNIPEGYVYENLIKRNHIYAPAVMFRRKLTKYVNFNEYIEQGFMMEDYPMWLEFSRHTKFFYLDISTVTYRVNINSASIFDDYEKTIAFEDNLYKVQKYFHSKYPSDNVQFETFEELYYIQRWNCARQFNVRKDIMKYAKYLPHKTIKQKIKVHLLSKCVTIGLILFNIYSKLNRCFD